MYRDVKGSYWWNNMKKDIAKFVEQCLTYQQVKAKHQKLARTLKPLLIPKWKVGQDRYGFYFGVTQGTHWGGFHLGCCRSSNEECSLYSHQG
jgi:hypothetical protein